MCQRRQRRPQRPRHHPRLRLRPLWLSTSALVVVNTRPPNGAACSPSLPMAVVAAHTPYGYSSMINRPNTGAPAHSAISPSPAVVASGFTISGFRTTLPAPSCPRISPLIPTITSLVGAPCPSATRFQSTPGSKFPGWRRCRSDPGWPVLLVPEPNPERRPAALRSDWPGRQTYSGGYPPGSAGSA